MAEMTDIEKNYLAYSKAKLTDFVEKTISSMTEEHGEGLEWESLKTNTLSLIENAVLPKDVQLAKELFCVTCRLISRKTEEKESRE